MLLSQPFLTLSPLVAPLAAGAQPIPRIGLLGELSWEPLKQGFAISATWRERTYTEKFFDPRAAWPQYRATIVRLTALPCGHYPAEQVPDQVYEELYAFFGS